MQNCSFWNRWSHCQQLRLWHTQILSCSVHMHFSFLTRPTVSLKSLQGEGISCEMFLSAQIHILREREKGHSSSTSPFLFGDSPGYSGRWKGCWASQPRLGLRSVPVHDKSPANGKESEACTADMETLWNIQASLSMEILDSLEFTYQWRVGVGSPLEQISDHWEEGARSTIDLGGFLSPTPNAVQLTFTNN